MDQIAPLRKVNGIAAVNEPDTEQFGVCRVVHNEILVLKVGKLFVGWVSLDYCGVELRQCGGGRSSCNGGFDGMDEGPKQAPMHGVSHHYNSFVGG